MKRNVTLAVLVIGIAALAVLFMPSSFSKPADQMGHDPGSTGLHVARAVNFAESAPLAEIAKTQEPGAARKRERAVDREELLEKQREKAARAVGFIPAQQGADNDEKEINKTNREIMRAFDYRLPGTPDGALAAVPENKGGRELAPQVMPTPLVSFNGVGNPEGCGGCLPPDTNGEIGPTQYVQTVNTAFRIFDRAGTPQIPVMTLGSIFASLPGSCANTNDGDPIVMYDQLADRWLISEFCVSVANPNNHQLIAISKTGDATGAYYLYDFMMPNNKFNDYPHFGVWPDGYYMTDNQFNQAGTAFEGAGVFAFDRVKMLAGDPTATFIYFDKAEGCAGAGAGCLFGGMLPTDLDGFVPPPAGAPNSIIQFEADEFGNGMVDSLRILDFHADFATPANSTLTAHAGSPVSVAAFDPREVPSGSRNIVPQPAGVPLDVISDRLMFRLAYRNYGDHESLVMNHSVNALTNPAFRAGVRYYEIRKSTPAAPWTVQEQATMAGAVGDLEHRWMGSTAQNAAGSQAVGYSVSSSTTFPSIRYAGRLATDPAGSLAQGEGTLVAGTGAQTSTSGRWGDYSDLTVDPTDDCTFWYTTEYYSVTSGSNWATRIGSFKFGPCATVQKGVLTGTITSAATGNPIANATVVASNGFSRSSGVNGVYTIDPMGPGTVTLTVSAPNYVTATINNVSVTVGNTTTQNVQLTPLSNIVAGTATITADSCNSNMTLDPNEIVTVNFGLLNNGGDGATTTNLVATLQATGGVTNPSGPQNYGAVVAGQPAVTRPFTFTVSATCGGTVTATLQLQDGATNLGTRTFTFTVGTLSQITRTSGSVAVPIPDNLPTGVDIPITVPDTVSISDINVRVRLNHTFDGDLAITLIHPDNTSVALSTNRGGSGDNYGTGANDCTGMPTVFDDQAATTIATGTAPFAGSFKPDGSLAALNGKPANGTWKLHVVDNASIDTGTVGCVTLEINTKFVCCGAQIVAAPPPVITAESVSPANNAADPEETVTVNLALVNNGGSPTTNLVATLQPTGGVAGPSAPQSYGVLAASGGTATRPFTFTAQGTCGSTITLTLALQDGATNLGTVTYTMQLGSTSIGAPTAFTNSASVTIPATGTGATGGAPATPYPSNIVVSGLSGNIAKVTVGLNNLNHTFPSDVDMLLVGPGGQSFIILSDVIGGTDWVGINYTLDDAAAAVIPGTGAPASGTFKPTNYGTGDGFPAPAPAAPYQSPGTAGTATFASVFNGTSANGTWSLYVVDDAGTDAGTMTGGWTINITTAQPACNTQTCTITAPTSVTIPPGSCGTIVNYSPAVTFTGACGVVVGPTPPSGSFFGIGTRTVLVRGTRADASFTDASFPVTVQDNETLATGLGANVTNTYCNTTVNFNTVTGAGSTTVVDAPAQTLPPPYVHCTSCPELNITTTASFTAPVTTCITMPASTDFNTFSRLRILHGEGGPLVNRTISSNFTTKTICARTTTVSPFVVVLDPNAPTAAPATISGRITSADGQPIPGVTMNLSGARTARVITDSNGDYRFAAMDTDNFYTVTPALVNYHFGPDSRSFSLLANRTDAVFTAMPDAVGSGNAIDTPDYFVRQQYLDFLGREPDESGFNFWSDQISSCGSDAGCLESRTINVSAAYFLSIEFQQTGGLVDGLYRASYGRAPRYAEFMPDAGSIARNVQVGGADWAQTLESNKQIFIDAWVQRAAFQSAYGNLNNESYVSALINHTGVSFSQGERNELVSGLTNATLTRADVLRKIAENDRFVSAKRNATFVMMEYFGYLRRDPDDSGYQFWLGKLNQFAGNFERAEMVKAFIQSGEYRQRFSQ